MHGHRHHRSAEARKDIFIDAISNPALISMNTDKVRHIDSYLSQKLKGLSHQWQNLIIAELVLCFTFPLWKRVPRSWTSGFPLVLLKQLMSIWRQYWINLKCSSYFEWNFHLKHCSDLEIDDVILIDENYSQHLQTVLPKRNPLFQFKQPRLRSF